MERSAAERNASDESQQRKILHVTLRKLRNELVECRRSGGTRLHHRMEVERLTEELIEEVKRYEWGAAPARRLKHIQQNVHHNGLTSTNCKDLELVTDKLRRFENTVNGPDFEDSWEGWDE